METEQSANSIQNAFGLGVGIISIGIVAIDRSIFTTRDMIIVVPATAAGTRLFDGNVPCFVAMAATADKIKKVPEKMASLAAIAPTKNINPKASSL